MSSITELSQLWRQCHQKKVYSGIAIDFSNLEERNLILLLCLLISHLLKQSADYTYSAQLNPPLLMHNLHN